MGLAEVPLWWAGCWGGGRESAHPGRDGVPACGRGVCWMERLVCVAEGVRPDIKEECSGIGGNTSRDSEQTPA